MTPTKHCIETILQSKSCMAIICSAFHRNISSLGIHDIDLLQLHNKTTTTEINCFHSMNHFPCFVWTSRLGYLWNLVFNLCTFYGGSWPASFLRAFVPEQLSVHFQSICLMPVLTQNALGEKGYQEKQKHAKE